MDVIKDKELVLAKHITAADIKEGLSFFSEDGEYLQAGAWNYPAGTQLKAHIHHEVERVVKRTYEVLYVIQGSIKATIYNLDAEVVRELVIGSGEILMLLESGHGYEILEDDTKVLEIKNGPYLGADVDRYRI